MTSSWKVHSPSSTHQPPQDFITINKLAVKMNATTYGTHKDFRKNIDIKKRMKFGKTNHPIYLPPNEFTYGLGNRPPTPFKDVICYGYHNRAEDVIKKEYKQFMHDKMLTYHLVPRTTQHFYNILETRRNQMNHIEKPLYKMKMFKNIGSRVTEGIKQFKTYHPFNKKEYSLDNMINKVQNELGQIDGGASNRNECSKEDYASGYNKLCDTYDNNKTRYKSVDNRMKESKSERIISGYESN